MATTYVYEWMTQKEMVEKMEKEIMKTLLIPFKFNIELSCDGVLALRNTRYKFTREELEKMGKLDWFEQGLKTELETSGRVDNPLGYLKYPLSELCHFFDYILEKTFGKGTKIVSVKKEITHINLKIAIPMKNRLFKNTSLI